MIFARRRAWLFILVALLLLCLWTFRSPPPVPVEYLRAHSGKDDDYFWRRIPVHFPPKSIRPLPAPGPSSPSPPAFPRVQAVFDSTSESEDARQKRSDRRRAVKDVFARCWKSYRQCAWTADELTPVSCEHRDPFGGWAATLVDSLDTLWIMDMRAEFDEAVSVASSIDFTTTTLEQINVFETNIRYLGGFLSAYDLSGDQRLLRKAIEVGDMLYKAFDTPNRMPVLRWDYHAAARGERQTAGGGVLVAEIGSLSLEFTRLSQVTGDPRWFDAIQRITDEMAAQQDSTSLPGLFPLTVDANWGVFNRGNLFTLGAMADSLYEYMPKMAALLDGQLPVYQSMYEKAVTAAIKHGVFWRPMTPNNDDILISGIAHVKMSLAGKTRVEVDPQGQHLVCFVGGMLALAGKLFGREEDVTVGSKLVDGCVWTYKALPHGIMPETFYITACHDKNDCKWDEELWKQQVLSRAKDSSKDKKGGAQDDEEPEAAEQAAAKLIAEQRLPPGFTSIPDRRYILRPEAIESVFVLYRTTGRTDLLESAWDMFQAIDRATRTEFANTAVRDVTSPTDDLHAADSMESFWMGETLKYLYLIFSDTSVIDLDEYVFNTEAHPFKRPLRT